MFISFNQQDFLSFAKYISWEIGTFCYFCLFVFYFLDIGIKMDEMFHLP